MDEKALVKIQGWFETLNVKFETLDHKFETLDHKFETLDHKFETLDHKFETKFEALERKFDAGHPDMVRKQEFEDRFQILLKAVLNTHTRVKNHKSEQDHEIYLLKLALRQLGRDVESLQAFHLE